MRDDADDVRVDADGWTLRAGSGWSEVRAERRGEWHENPALTVYVVTLEYTAWDRLAPLENADRVRDAHVTLDQMLVAEAAMAELTGALTDWLERPMTDWVAAPFRHVAVLASEPGQRLALRFAPDTSLITGAGGTVCKVEFATGRLNGEFVLDLDPTALSSFRDDLARVAG
jgi:hypothetical protein